jgi:hypothetical protein
VFPHNTRVKNAQAASETSSFSANKSAPASRVDVEIKLMMGKTGTWIRILIVMMLHLVFLAPFARTMVMAFGVVERQFKYS